MPDLKAFKGIVAEEKYKANFAIRSLDNYTFDEIETLVNSTSTTFLDIIFPTIQKNELKTESRFKKVRRNIENFLKNKKVIEDKLVSIYIYEQIKPNGKHYTGFLGLLNLQDYRENRIKKHEDTIIQREETFANYLEHVHLQAEPTLVTYKESSKLDVMMEREKKGIPIVKITDKIGISHKVWRVDNRLKIQQFKEVIQELKALYIADGHHRMGSTAMYQQMEQAQNNEHIGNEPYNYILSYIVPSHELMILEFNRLIKDLNGLTKDEFLQKISKYFNIIHKGNTLYYPSKKFHYTMYLEGEFYALYINKEFRDKPEGLGELDTYLLQEYLLKPILNIQDARNDSRIAYKKGTGNIEGIKQLKEEVDSGNYKVAFGLFPMTFDEMKHIADLDLRMPPKSTYIEPKLLSGLVMYKMK